MLIWLLKCTHAFAGFCFFNSVAVAAKHAIKEGRAKKVAIIDYDIHHGNGTQELIYDDPNILFISLHRYSTKSNDKFFPGTGASKEIGSEQSLGTNLNIAWKSMAMGNTEYAMALSELVLPVLSAFDPNLVIVSSGFDAAEGDLIGDCSLSPSMFHSMTRCILETVGVNTPVVVALEGGYNIDVTSSCMEAVALALIDEDWSDEMSDPQDRTKLASQLLTEIDKENNRANINNGDEVKYTRLQKGRQALSHEWDNNNNNKGLVKQSAIRDVNRSIEAIRQYVSADLSKISVPAIQNRRIKTRSRSKAKSLEQALESLHL